MSGEDFLLKWNDHHSLFFAGAEQLCESEEYTDVTLAAGSKFFPAHKLVLSICSPYFQKLFRRLGTDKPVIFLKDVDPKHLELLLQYMYKGEIKVEENELVTVLNTAQGLEIKGLTDSTETGSSKSSEPPKSTPYRAPVPASAPKRPSPSPLPQSSNQYERKKPKVAPSDALYKLSNVHVSPAMEQPPPPPVRAPPPPQQEQMVSVKQEVAPVTIDLEQPQDTAMQGYEDGMGQDMAYSDTTVATGYEGEEGYEEYYQDGVMVPGSGDQDDRAWTGHLKDIEKMKTENLREENNVDISLQMACPVCGKQFATKHNLNQHMRVHSGERPFGCPVCGKGFKQKAHMQKHLSAHRNKEPLAGVLWMGNTMEDADGEQTEV